MRSENAECTVGDELSRTDGIIGCYGFRSIPSDDLMSHALRKKGKRCLSRFKHPQHVGQAHAATCAAPGAFSQRGEIRLMPGGDLPQLGEGVVMADAPIDAHTSEGTFTLVHPIHERNPSARAKRESVRPCCVMHRVTTNHWPRFPGLIISLDRLSDAWIPEPSRSP